MSPVEACVIKKVGSIRPTLNGAIIKPPRVWKATVSRLSAPPTVWALVIATQGHLAVAFGLANQGRVKDASYEPVQDNPQMRPAVATFISVSIKSDKARKKNNFFSGPISVAEVTGIPSIDCNEKKPLQSPPSIPGAAKQVDNF